IMPRIVFPTTAPGYTFSVGKRIVAGSLFTALVGCTGFGPTNPATEVEGRDKSAKTNVLEAGAAVLQPDGPLEPMTIYLVGFHPMKDDPSHQMEAHHFCTQVNE